MENKVGTESLHESRRWRFRYCRNFVDFRKAEDMASRILFVRGKSGHIYRLQHILSFI